MILGAVGLEMILALILTIDAKIVKIELTHSCYIFRYSNQAPGFGLRAFGFRL